MKNGSLSRRTRSGKALTILLVLVLLGLGAAIYFPRWLASGSSDPAAVQKAMQVLLPPEAGDVEGSSGGFPDSFYRLTFTLPKGELSPFLEQVGAPEIGTEGERPFQPEGFPTPTQWATWEQEKPVRQWGVLVSEQGDDARVSISLFVP